MDWVTALIWTIVAFFAAFFGAYIGCLAAREEARKPDSVPPTEERPLRAPVYNTPSKAAAYMASESLRSKLPGAWKEP